MRKLCIFAVFMTLAALLVAQTSADPRLGSLILDDGDSFLDIASQGRAIQTIIEPGALAGKSITLSDNARISLQQVALKLKESTTAFDAEVSLTMQRARNAIDSRKLISLAVETPDAFILTEGISLNVKDPVAFAQHSPEFRSYIQGRPRTPSFARLSLKEKQQVEDYLKKKSGGNRILFSNAQLEQAFNDISAGKGDFEVTETMMIPKIAKWRPVILHLPPSADPTSEPTPEPSPLPATVIRSTGETSFNKRFMVGYTVDIGAEWEKRWRFTGGLFRMTVGASFTAGLRIPLELKARNVKPTRIEIVRGTDLPMPVSANLAFVPFDGSAEDYRALGLVDSHVDSRGKEFALGGSIDLGYKFSIFSQDIIHRKISPIVSFNFGEDFVPPLNRPMNTIIPIDMKYTKTGLNFTGFSGGLQLGLNFEMTGVSKLDARWKMNGFDSDFRTLTFANANEQPFSYNLPALGDNSTAIGRTISRPYSLELKNPKYTLTGSVAPCARIIATVDLAVYSANFSTSWRTLDSFRVNLGSYTFDTHRGTPNRQIESVGIKSYTKENTASPSLAGRVRLVLAARSNPRHVAISRDADGNNYLAMVNEPQHSFDLEYIDPAMATAADNNPRYVVLYSSLKDCFIRSGIGATANLGASGVATAPRGRGWDKSRDWEVFRIEQVAEGYVLRSEVGGHNKYVSVVNGKLRADTASRNSAAVFVVQSVAD